MISYIEEDYRALFKACSKYPIEKLKSPFEAEVNEYQEFGCFTQQGNRLNIIRIES